MKISIDLAQLSLYTRQLAVLIRCGVPIPQSFRALTHGESQALNQAFNQVADQIETGTYISTSCSMHPHIFPLYYLGLLQVGEASGTLCHLLDELASYLNRAHTVSKKIYQALTYPLILCCACLILLLFLLAYILPLMAPLFAQAGAPLPWLTQGCLAIAEALGKIETWAGIALTGSLIFLLFLQIQQAEINSPLRQSLDEILLRLPLIGKLWRWTVVAQILKLLALMVKAGVDIRLIIATIYRSMSLQEYRQALLDMEDALMEGKSLSEALQVSGAFPVDSVHMVAVGEESGRLQQMLEVSAKLYEEQAITLTDTLITLLEPILLCIASLLVGTVCIAILLPWMSLLSQLH